MLRRPMFRSRTVWLGVLVSVASCDKATTTSNADSGPAQTQTPTKSVEPAKAQQRDAPNEALRTERSGSAVAPKAGGDGASPLPPAPEGFATVRPAIWHDVRGLRAENAEALARMLEAELVGEGAEEGARATHELRTDGPDQRATIELTGLADDSVKDEQYEAVLTSEGSSWTIVQLGLRWRCQPQRGSQTWTTELCM